MAKRAYHIISDLHLDRKVFKNRFNYVNETSHVLKELVALNDEYLNKGYENINILLGDVFNKGYGDIIPAVQDNNFFVELNKKYGNLYSVLGNHETTYYKNNPFFTLMKDIESDKVKQIKHKIWTPVGLMNTINVVDTLTDGEVIFHFNHHSTPVNKAVPGMKNIGLFHQEIVCNDIVQSMKMEYGKDVFTEEKIIFKDNFMFKDFSYNFFGHLHSIYGTWVLDSFGQQIVMCYLASLGRTKENEVANNFLERNIPTVLVEDGVFSGVKDHLFNLLSRELCIKEDIVELTKATYEIGKLTKSIRSTAPNGQDPINNLKDYCSTDPMLAQMLEDLLETDYDRYNNVLDREFQKIGD